MEQPIEEKIYTRTDLVTFGNYLLSEARAKMFENATMPTEEELNEYVNQVHHADIENWIELENPNPSVKL